MNKIVGILFILWTSTALSQVKVGDRINTIDAASILELESTTKAFVLTRMDNAQMNAITPLNGAMVYNTDVKCIFVYEGTTWKNLCATGIQVTSQATSPVDPIEGDIWCDETTGATNIWDGVVWRPVIKNFKVGTGTPSGITDALPGYIYVDTISGDLYTYDGSIWIIQTTNASNGINKLPDNTIELGGSLTKATEIQTDNTNTLAIRGLDEVGNTNNQMVTIEPSTGIIRRSPVESMIQQEEIVIIANENQTQFSPPLPITSSAKINIYRNGIRIGFNVIDPTTLELETGVVCFQNDEIRIVQLH